MKKFHVWRIYFNNPNDKFGWWIESSWRTRESAREYVKQRKKNCPRFQWKIVKEFV